MFLKVDLRKGTAEAEKEEARREDRLHAIFYTITAKLVMAKRNFKKMQLTCLHMGQIKFRWSLSN
jgi:hypothetical protein